MSQQLLVNVELPDVSGDDAETIVNTFAMDVPTVWDEGLDLLNLTGPIADFYNHSTGGARAIGKYLSSTIDRAAGACAIKVYDVSTHLSGTPHGSPIAVDHFTLTPYDANDSLPSEVALALTLRAVNWAAQPVERADGGDAGSAIDRPRERYTGKLFIGPFNGLAKSATVETAPSRPLGTMQTAFLNAAEWMTDQLAAHDIQWCVWSRADATFRQITHVQVDDAWDTQRRRGRAATGRTQRLVYP